MYIHPITTMLLMLLFTVTSTVATIRQILIQNQLPLCRSSKSAYCWSIRMFYKFVLYQCIYVIIVCFSVVPVSICYYSSSSRTITILITVPVPVLELKLFVNIVLFPVLEP